MTLDALPAEGINSVIDLTFAMMSARAEIPGIRIATDTDTDTDTDEMFMNATTESAPAPVQIDRQQ